MVERKYELVANMTDGEQEVIGEITVYDGEDGKTPYVKDGYWWIGETNTNIKAEGVDGKGILSTEKTASNGLVDTYTITFTDNSTTTFTVTNGEQGVGIQSVGVVGGQKGDEYSITTLAITLTNGKVQYVDITVQNGKKGDTYILTEADKAEMVADAAEEVILAIKQRATLGLHTDGLLYIFVDGQPIGNGISMPDKVGDVYGNIDSNMNLILRGDMPDGTYTAHFDDEKGSIAQIGVLVKDMRGRYSITSTLTQCTSNNSVKEIIEGESYSATFTANSGYYMSSIKVTMGGTDISSSAVNGNKITIASVTGNVVITANAVAIPTYSITKNLTNCTISNSATSIQQGSAYSATITANSGYELKSISVTMGGNTVSVSGGTINIASVMGNIVITAVAEAVSTNALPNAINADGTLFVGTNGEKGYKTGVRISGSSGGESTQAGCMATGFIAMTEKQKAIIENITPHSSSNYNVVVYYDASFAKVINTTLGTPEASGCYVLAPAGMTGAPNIRYVRFSCATITENSSVTIQNK